MLNMVFKCQHSALNINTPQGLASSSPTDLFRKAIDLCGMKECVISLLPGASLVGSLLLY